MRFPTSFHLQSGSRGVLLGLALLLARPAPAQVPPAPAGGRRPDTLAAAPADTVAALRRLFASRRSGVGPRLISVGVGVLASNFAVSQSRWETTRQRLGGGIWVGLLGLNLYNLTKITGQQRRYRPARERRLLADLAQGRPLPAPLRRQLVVEYLPPPTPRP